MHPASIERERAVALLYKYLPLYTTQQKCLPTPCKTGLVHTSDFTGETGDHCTVMWLWCNCDCDIYIKEQIRNNTFITIKLSIKIIPVVVFACVYIASILFAKFCRKVFVVSRLLILSFIPELTFELNLQFIIPLALLSSQDTRYFILSKIDHSHNRM